jgi:hypothetical protein
MQKSHDPRRDLIDTCAAAEHLVDDEAHIAQSHCAAVNRDLLAALKLAGVGRRLPADFRGCDRPGGLKGRPSRRSSSYRESGGMRGLQVGLRAGTVVRSDTRDRTRPEPYSRR